jgi:hypothetical protein
LYVNVGGGVSSLDSWLMVPTQLTPPNYLLSTGITQNHQQEFTIFDLLVNGITKMLCPKIKGQLWKEKCYQLSFCDEIEEISLFIFMVLSTIWFVYGW